MDAKQLILLGKEHYNKGLFLQAAEFFQVAIDNDPNKEEAYFYLADTYLKLGKNTLAKSTIYKYLVINPESIKAIERIKSIDSKNYSNSPTAPNPSQNGLSGTTNTIKYKVVKGHGRMTDCDLYIQFEGGGVVLVNIEGANATVIKSQGLKELHLPKTIQFNGVLYPITKIDDQAFYITKGVRVVHLPDTIQEIGDKAFYLSDLKQIKLPNSLKYIGNEAFGSCESLKDIVIPDSVVEIGKGCFSSCEYLESISISTSVTVLKDDTFNSCRSLKTIIIPDSIVEIGRGCFAYTKNLETIEIPSSVNEIKDGAFWNCGLKTIEFLGPPPKIGSSSFDSSVRVRIHEEFKEQYQKSPYWSPIIKTFKKPD